ncbi:MAG: acetate/propionate family kinase [Ottowia sp.]|nr:acetate/propionate family kinase [Ottowia sp.]
MNDGLILVLNSGSSSIKFALFDAGVRPLPRQPAWGGQVQGIGGSAPTFEQSGAPSERITLDAKHPNTAALALIRKRVLQRLAGRSFTAVAHRVVHGGNSYFAPTRVSQAVIEDLRGLIPLAPLHQPFPLKAMSLLLEQHPGVPQVACFDTAFHRTMPQVEQLLPLRFEAWERGLRRYGFHGLSYEYLSHVLPERHADAARGRTIACHLGNGASLCAMQDLQSVATTMGFSALDGLMMGTRCGALDPGAVIYLMEIEKLSLAEVAQALYHDSGLLGVSGVSSDLRVLEPLEDENERVRAALALYVRRIVREIGALAAVLGGLDMLAFTAGVGEHSAFVRARVCRDLAFLGIELDDAANLDNAAVISSRHSRVRVVVEPTNEEWVVARHALDLVGSAVLAA